MITYQVEVYTDGSQFWYLNGKSHREDGPAAIHSTGTQFWYLNGKLHREDGPAAVYSDGTQFWYLNGIGHTEDRFNKKSKKTECEGKVVEIDGKQYKLIAI